jgi:DNA ligase-1
MVISTLYKANKDKVQVWTMEVLDDKYRSSEGFVDGTITTSEWTVAKPKNVGKSNETTGPQQALAEALAKVKKKIEKDWYEDINDIDEDSPFSPMLAHKYTDQKKKIKFPCLEQPKLDGMRCTIDKRGMWSRERKPIISAPHIFNALKDVFEEYPELILDGELYNHEYHDNFDAIISLVRKTRPTEDDLEESKKMVEYHVYDALSRRGCERTFEDRMFTMNTVIDIPHIKLVDTTTCYTQEELDDRYSIHLQNGYEGQMVRNNERYEEKRSYNLQKRKEFVDAEFKIVDVLEGEGNRSGMLGKFVLDNEKGELFESSARGTYEKFREILQNKESYVGKSATVRYQNLTPRGVPRFPVVVDIAREDYE